MRFSVALALFLVLTSSALAKETLTIHPIFESNGKFGFCLGEQHYEDGRALTFALSPKKEINIGAHIPKAGLKKDHHYDIVLRLDQESPRKIRSKALDDETILLQMGGNPVFREALRAAQNLSLGSGKQAVAFALPAMKKLVGTLEICVANNQGKKFEDSQKAPLSPSAFPDALKKILTSAGFTSIKPLPMNDIPVEKRPADFLWETGKILGGVRETKVPSNQTLDELIGLHIKGLSKKCHGEFKSTILREQTAAGVRLRRAEASCTPELFEENRPVSVSLIFSLTERSVFTVFTHEGFSEDSAEVFEARDRLTKTLLESLSAKTPR